MPILDVEIVLEPGQDLPEGIAAAIAERAAEIFESAPRTTWVKVRGIASETYAENGSATGPHYPVIISVLKAHLPPPEELQREVSRLTAGMADVCARPPEHVHVIYLPDAAGRIAFGGEIRR